MSAGPPGAPALGHRRFGGATRVTLVLALLFAWATLTLPGSGGRLLELPAQLARMFGLLFPPDLEYGRESVLPAVVESIQIAWVGTIIGALFSLPLGFLAASNLTGRASAWCKLFLVSVRAMPEILLAIYFVPIVGLGSFAGTLAIGIHSIGTLGKLTAEVVESMDDRPAEAIRACGGSRLDEMRFALLPQVLPEIVAVWLYRFEINLRASAVLGVVGAGGIGGVLLNTLRYRRFDKAGAVVVVTVVVVLAVDTLSGLIRKRLTR